MYPNKLKATCTLHSFNNNSHSLICAPHNIRYLHTHTHTHFNENNQPNNRNNKQHHYSSLHMIFNMLVVYLSHFLLSNMFNCQVYVS